MAFQLLELVGGGWVQTPDSAGLSIEDNLDLRIRCALDDWAPSSRQVFLAKSTGGEEWSFHTASDGSGLLELVWVNVSATTSIEQSSVATGFAHSSTHWVRVRRSGTSVTFYTSDDDTNDHTAVSWTQLGSTQTTASGDIDSTISTHVTVGASRTNGDDPIRGFVFAAAVVEDSTTRADPTFTSSGEWTVGENGGDSDSASDGTNTWTLGGTAEIVGDNIHGVYLTCDAAFGTDPFYSQVVWSSLRSDMRAVSFTRGRQYELDRVQAGTMTVTLTNSHGNYNAHNTAGAYYPNVKPTVPIRLRAVYDGVVYPLWSGFVERWPASFPGKKDAVVDVECVDLFKLLSLNRAASVNRTTAVDALTPEGWWRFGSTADETGNGHTLTFSGSPTAGDAEGAWENDEATTFDGTDDYADPASPSGLVRNQADRTWEVWVYPATGGTFFETIVEVDDDAGLVVVKIAYDKSNDTFRVSSHGNTKTWAASPDTWHHVVVSDDFTGSTFERNIYWNSTPIFSFSRTEASSSGHTVRFGNDETDGAWFEGRISEIAFYTSALTDEEVVSLYLARTEGYNDELTSARIAFLLDNFTYPISPDQNLETGQTTMDGPNSPTDQTVLEAILTATDTENGVFFIAGDGAATFHDRHYRSQDQASVVASLDQDDYTDVVIGVDDELVYNDVRVKPDDSSEPAVTENSDSIEAHGRRTLNKTIYPADPNEALDASAWLAYKYGLPETRIEQLRFRLDGSALTATLLDGEISNKYGVSVPLTGDDLATEVFLERVSHSISASTRVWDIAWQLSPADTQTMFILDDDNVGELDGPGVLAY